MEEFLDEVGSQLRRGSSRVHHCDQLVSEAKKLKRLYLSRISRDHRMRATGYGEFLQCNQPLFEDRCAFMSCTGERPSFSSLRCGTVHDFKYAGDFRNTS